jgi:DNA/RNA endonuclease G, NUC1
MMLPHGVLDPGQVTAATRTFAVKMPNTQGIRDKNWKDYKVSVREIENLTGYNFFSNVPQAIQNSIENGIDGVSENPPGTADQTIQDTEDSPAQFTLNAVNPTNTTMVATLSQPGHGTINCAGINCTYTPNTNYNGSDAFTFSVNNGSKTSNTSTVTLDVAPVNDAPTATAQTISTDEDNALPVTLSGSDVETPAANLTYQVTQNPSHGSLSGAGANLTYTPAANFNGSDNFKFTVTDTGDGSSGALTSSEATISISVNPVNDAPVANAQSVSTNEDTPKSITLTGNDIETAASDLIYTVTQSPAHGTLSGNGASLIYSPAADYNGGDSFKFTVTDTGDGSSPQLTSGEAAVTITVNPVNDAPTANGQSVVTDEDTPKAIMLAGTDTETPAANLTYTVTQAPVHGTLSGSNANLTYTPNADYNGGDNFKFTVTDTGDGPSAPLTSSEATVTITVNPVNDPPVANSQTVNLDEDTSRSTTLTGSDVETPASGLNYAVTQGPLHGLLSGAGANLTYTPVANYNGSDSFKFTVTDTGDGASGALTSSEGTVSITINSVNDLPVVTSNQTAPASAQYSDAILPITFRASDIETPAGSLVPSYTFTNGSSVQSGLPGDLSLVQTATPGVWTLGGNINEPMGTYTVNVTFTDADGGKGSTSIVINVNKEDAALTISGPTSVAVAAVGGKSQAFTLNANVSEIADGAAGDIRNAAPVTFQLTPVGSALPAYTCVASAITPGTTAAPCTFTDVNVDVYDVTAIIGGNYYKGGNKSVIAVYDPSLGFVSGSGTVSRTVNGETFTADFSVNLKYKKDGTAQGSLTYIEHHASGDVGLTSNSMGALAVVGSEAKMTGTGTLNGLGSYSFLARFIDMGEPGSNDSLGLRITDSSGNTIADLTFDPVKLSGGNIQVH